MNKYIISICLSFLYLALGVSILTLDRLCVMDILYLFTCRPVNLSTCPPGLTGHEIIPECRTLWIYPTCSLVDLSTCSQRLTVAIFSSGVVKRYIDVQCIMGRPYMPRCHPVKLSPTFGRSRGEYR